MVRCGEWFLVLASVFGEPLEKAGVLGGAQLDAVADAAFGSWEGALGGVDGVGGEEAADLLLLFGGAEVAGGGDDACADEGCELGLNEGPVGLHPGPGAVAGFAVIEQADEDVGGILLADAAGGGELKGAGDEGWGGETGKEAASFGLAIGIGAVGGGGGDDAVVKVGFSCGGGGDVEGGLGERGVDRVVGLTGGGVDAVGDAVGFGEDGGVACGSEEFEEEGAALLKVDGVGLPGGAEGGVDGGELCAESGEETGPVGGGGNRGLELVDLVEGGIEDGAAGIGLEGEDQVEEVGDGGLLCAGEGPLVAEKADALGWGEGGFGTADDGGELGGGVARAVVAFVVGVGVKEGACDGDRRWIGIGES